LRALCAWLALLTCSQQLLSAARAQAQGGTEVHARVVVDSAEIRAGPGASYRKLYTAHRDEVFPLRSRAARGYWFEVELPDGTTGFVRGELVYNSEVSEREATGGRFLPQLFAPPPLAEARGEIALCFGALGSGGMVALRPSWLIAPSFGIEVTGGAAVAQGGRLFMAMIGPVVNLFPRSPVVPFFNLAGGLIASSPNADTFLLRGGNVTGLAAGAGLRIGFRYRLTLRLEARSYVFFETDRYVREEELSAGLSVFL
jgi:hypothetical protein